MMGRNPVPVEIGGRWSSAAVRGLLAIAIVLVLKLAADLLVPIAVAVVLTFVLAPAVRALRRFGLPETLGAGLVVGLLLATTVLLASMLSGPASAWWERAPQTVAQVMAQVERLRDALPRFGASTPPATPPATPRARAQAERAVANAPDPLKEHLATEGVAFTRVVIGKVLSLGLSTAAAVILLYFLLASEHWVITRSIEAIPRRRSRALLLAGLRSVQREIGRFVSSLALINIGVATATSLAVWWVDLPNPLLWGVVAGVLNFIPYLGPMITVAMLALAGVLTFDSATAMLAPAALFVCIHAIESNIVSPWFVGRRLTLSPVAVFVSVMFWGWAWGIAGAMMAVPALVGLRSVCKRQRRLRLLCAYLEGSYQPVPSLRSLLRPRRKAGRASG
jgi:predicted PurR-regulated permease PerM